MKLKAWRIKIENKRENILRKAKTWINSKELVDKHWQHKQTVTLKWERRNLWSNSKLDIYEF